MRNAARGVQVCTVQTCFDLIWCVPVCKLLARAVSFGGPCLLLCLPSIAFSGAGRSAVLAPSYFTHVRRTSPQNMRNNSAALKQHMVQRGRWLLESNLSLRLLWSQPDSSLLTHGVFEITHEGSLPEFMDFKLVGKTILVANPKAWTCFGQSTGCGSKLHH